jgi:imidazolonepropionase-like amidohydrolase
VVLADGLIRAVGGPIPSEATILDGTGGTLLPGLIDSHVHTDMNGLRDALAFGITSRSMEVSPRSYFAFLLTMVPFTVAMILIPVGMIARAARSR